MPLKRETMNKIQNGCSEIPIPDTRKYLLLIGYARVLSH